MASGTEKSALQTALRAAHRKKEKLRISGLSRASSAYVIASYFTEERGLKNRPQLLCICSNDQTAIEFKNDLDCFLLSFGAHQTIQPLLYPTWEKSPYGPVSPSIRTRFTRIRALQALAAPHNETEPQLLLTSLAGLSQSTIPPEQFLQFSISLTVGKALISRETCIQALTNAGYERTDAVEDVGTFSVRGEILDIFPPTLDQPVRIVLFDQTVESIKTFDSTSQRTNTKQHWTHVQIPPARELLINSSTQPTLRNRIKALADNLGISRYTRDPLLAAIQMGSYPHHSDAWISFAYLKPSTLLDYLSQDALILWIDEQSCLENWNTFTKTHSAEPQTNAFQHQSILPPFKDLFQWGPILSRLLLQHGQLFLDRLAIQKQNEKEPIQALISQNPQFNPGSTSNLDSLEIKLKQSAEQGFKIWIFASTKSRLDRIHYLLRDHGINCLDSTQVPTSGKILLATGSLSNGFQWDAEGLLVLSENEILGAAHRSSQKTNKKDRPSSAANAWSGLQALSDISIGDLVVHRDHGISMYQGLTRLSLLGAPADFLLLEFAAKDKLYLPVYRLNVIQKYSGAFEHTTLDRLGNQQFEKTKAKVKESLQSLAFNLVKLYAQRKISTGFKFSPRNDEFQEFEAQFSFDETPDQLTAIDEILHDLESGHIMDRIICGDVGYGKTEVAIRAAFRVATDGKQVVVLVPTTLLARQHCHSFQSRLTHYPIHVASLSRFKTKLEQKEILTGIQKGTIDIVIGTHRLLSKDIKFKDLGLIIIDEEHRFGVEHKELLKTLKINTPVLALTATPIPRTLHMALAGLRDISLIKTPPVDRLPIRTFVAHYDHTLIQQAIENELARGGQVFYLHNQIKDIFEVADLLRTLVPSAQVGVGHGQMPDLELEKTITLFYEQKINVFVCTTIIESGLDLPLANTIIIDRADRLGLAQLYQIRGRVGRSQIRAYAYLLIPEHAAISEDAKKRLEVLQKFVDLGSGFNIASHDLEIRGGGDLLGPAQSGNIAAVGFDLYTELLDEAIKELQGDQAAEPQMTEPDIKIPYPAFLAEDYVTDIRQRLALYRRFAAAKTEDDIQDLEEETGDRFGPLPAEAQNLLWLLRVKITLKKFGIHSLTVGRQKISFLPGNRSPIDTTRTLNLLASRPEEIQITPDSKLVVKMTSHSIKELYFQLEPLFLRFIC